MKKILALALITSSCWAMEKDAVDHRMHQMIVEEAIRREIETPTEKETAQIEEPAAALLKIERRKLEIAEKQLELTERIANATELQALLKAKKYQYAKYGMTGTYATHRITCKIIDGKIKKMIAKKNSTF